MKKENNSSDTYKQPFSEFREDYKGFDWENGEIVFVAKSNAAQTLIWDYGSLWQVTAEKHFDKTVINWKHTEHVMVITLDM